MDFDTQTVVEKRLSEFLCAGYKGISAPVERRFHGRMPCGAAYKAGVVQRVIRDRSAHRQIAARRTPGQDDRAGDERKMISRQDAAAV